MANRRMFSKTITNSSNFLMMPQSSQNLYWHLGMNADDDGFCEHFMVMRMTESKPDDLKILITKGFVQVFDDKVLVILDWKENNFIRSDRYTPSKYLAIYKEELKRLEFGIPNVIPMVDQRSPQVRLGKDIERENPPKVIKTKRDLNKRKDYLQTLSESEITTHMQKYLLSREEVLKEAEKAHNYNLANKKVIHDYAASFSNWLIKSKEYKAQNDSRFNKNVTSSNLD